MRPTFFLCLACLLPLSADAGDFTAKFPHQRQSRYFDFRYQSESWDAATFARFADAFVDLISRDFVKVTFDYPIKVLVLPDRASFQQFLRSEFREDNPPNFGIYLPRYKLFATYEESGLGTFAHEIMHPLVERNLGARPAWAIEAIPAFFEKFFGYWDNSGLAVHWGYQNPWRIGAIGNNLTRLDLAGIIADRRPVTDYNNSERRLVTVFLWQQGKFRQFLRLIAERNRLGYSSYLEAAMGMSLQDMTPLWQAYLNDIATHRAEIMEIPASAVFDNRETYDRLVLAREIPPPMSQPR